VTKIDAYLPPQDELSAATRRTDAANQRDNWLRQMELAQMAQMGARSGPATQAARPALAPFAQAPMHAPLRPADGRDKDAARQAADGPDAGSAAANGAGAPRQDSRGNADDTAPMTDDDDAGTAGAPAPAAAGLSPVPTAPAAGLAADALSGGAPLAAAGAGFAPATLPGVQRGVLEGLAPAPVGPLAVGVAAGLRPQQAALAAQADAPEAAEAPAPGADAASDAPDWQKRMMHLTGDGDDVKLWIRDGELSPAQSQQLVARLAADVAAMGLRLKEATVNGKPALRAAIRDADTDVDADAADGAAIPEPITHPTTER
jgi:hypothetical protein